MIQFVASGVSSLFGLDSDHSEEIEASDYGGIRYYKNYDSRGLGDDVICKAMISSIMVQAYPRIKSERIDLDVYLVSYLRRDDNSEWFYRCKVEGNRVVWASNTTNQGRWRTHDQDSQIFFKVDDNHLVIQEKFPATNELMNTVFERGEEPDDLIKVDRG